MKLTKKQQLLRHNILDKIYAKGPISRIDISKETGITPATVSEITGHFITDHLIHETGEVIPEETKSGRKKISLDISAEHSFYIGTELSEKYLSFCLCDNKGTLYEKKVIKATHTQHRNLDEGVFIDALQTFILHCHDYQPQAVGVALPGHFDQEQKRILTNNAFWKQFNLQRVMESIELPLYFDNNVQCMTNAQRLFSSENRDPNFIFFHVGRGMFCSCMYQGQLYGKENILVGEVGHTIVHPEGELCECGKRGCLQTYASEAWIINKSQLLFDNSDTTYLRQLATDRDNLTIDLILKTYKLGDEGVITILHNAIKYLAITINNLAMMIDSKKIFIHGELFNEGLLSDLLKEAIEKNTTILTTGETLEVELKEYSHLNGAIAACGLCVSETLLG